MPFHAIVQDGMVGKRTPVSVVLAEFESDGSGRFGAWARERLETVASAAAPSAAKPVDGFVLLALEREGLCFFVAAKRDAERAGREALHLIASSFAARIGMARARGATRRYAFNAEFAPPIQRHLEKFSKVGEVDEDLAELQSDIENVKGKAQGNIAKLAERGSILESVAATSGSMAASSERFRVSAHALKRQALWQGIKGKLVCAALSLVVGILIWLLIRA